MKINKDSNFLIVGLGLMGGSYAERLTSAGYKVRAIDINKESILIGKKRKIILNKDESEEELILEADFIILALFPSLCVNWVKENLRFFKKNVIITDMMGVKSNYISSIQALLKEEQEFISMHPMTGKESSGVANSSENIFNSSNMIIIPNDKNTSNGLKFAYSLAEILNVKNINELSPSDHDKIVGYVSHLSHIIAVTLMNSFDDSSLNKFAGTSFKEVTRIANINEEIWSELFIGNKKELLPLIESYQEQLELIRKAIECEDIEKVKEILKSSRIRRQNFNKD